MYTSHYGNELESIATKLGRPLKILFANVAMDGHFNPLTGIALHMKHAGHDVRWYSGSIYHKKISSWDIPIYPFKRTMEVTGNNLEELFPERRNFKGLAKLKFDIRNVFILRCPEQYEDVKEIKEEFDFDVLVCDAAFTGAVLIRGLLDIPVVSVSVFPLGENSKDLPPSGLGMTPASGWFGKKMQDLLRYVSDKLIFSDSRKQVNAIFHSYGLQPTPKTIFDLMYHSADIVLQTGTRSFEYKRSDMSDNIKFVGPLLPVSSRKPGEFKYKDRLCDYEKLILVTQGTIERDINKLLVPALEAFKNTDYLVVATTGGFGTEELRKRYDHKNIIIEDFIDFREVMPWSDVYISNGGFGGVQLAIEHALPMVVAGVHEGKNEICARVGYFKLGVNLRTEKPSVSQLKLAVDKVFSDPVFREKVKAMSKESKEYNTNELCERYITDCVAARMRHPEAALEAA